MTVVVEWLLWPCSVAALLLRAPTPSTRRSATTANASSLGGATERLVASPVERLRHHMRTLERRAERFRLEARHLEPALVTYHLSRRPSVADATTTALRALNSGERERVRSLLVRRERRLAESVRCERVALMLDRQLATLASTATLVDVVATLRVAAGAQKRLRRALDEPGGDALSIDELVEALEENEDVAASYAAALTRSQAMLVLDGDSLDGELEQLVAIAVESSTIEATARSLVATAPPAPTHEPEALVRSAVPV